MWLCACVCSGLIADKRESYDMWDSSARGNFFSNAVYFCPVAHFCQKDEN